MLSFSIFVFDDQVAEVAAARVVKMVGGCQLRRHFTTRTLRGGSGCCRGFTLRQPVREIIDPGPPVGRC